MAVTATGARFISLAHRRGVRLGALATMGRLGLYAPKPYLNELLKEAGQSGRFAISPGDPGLPRHGEFAEELYRHFGARTVDVMDGSAYEGANLIHDLNQPLPKDLWNRFDCVLDGGTLEHVFNPTEAIASYMKMVKTSGHIILLDMPTTNVSGHGFYQFSPAFFWQVFAPRYGFEVVEMIAADDRPFAPFFRVPNPKDLGRRVELVHHRPCYLYVLARKIGDFNGFGANVPIQDDYAQSWKAEASAPRPESRSPGGLLRKAFAVALPKTYWKLTNERNFRRRLKAMLLGGRRGRGPYSPLSDD